MKIVFEQNFKASPIESLNSGDLFILANQNDSMNPDVYMKIIRNGHIDYLNMATGLIKSGSFNYDTPIIKCQGVMTITKIY